MKRLTQLPSLDNLQCFLAAAEQLNFRRASQQMAMTPAAFGQRIKQLEQQLGCQLFRRTSRTIQLTEQAHHLIPAAQEALRSAISCAEVVQQEAQPTSIHLTLGTRFELGISWVVPAILTLQQLTPHLKIDLYFGSGPDIIEKLRSRQVDCIVTSAPELHREWTSAFLHHEIYVLVGAPKLLDNTPFTSSADASLHTLLDIDATLPLTRYLTSAIGELNFSNVRLLGAGVAIHHMVLEGFGLAVLPEYMVREDIQTGRLQHLLPNTPLLQDSFRLIFHRNALFHSHIQQVASFLAQHPLQ